MSNNISFDDITMNQTTRILAKFLEINIIESAQQRYKAMGYLYDVIRQQKFESSGDERTYELVKITIDNSEDNTICLIVSIQIEGSDVVSKIIIKEEETSINKLSITVVTDKNEDNLTNLCDHKIVELVKDDVIQKMEDIKSDAEQRIEDTWSSIGIKDSKGRSLDDIDEENIQKILDKIRDERGDNE